MIRIEDFNTIEKFRIFIINYLKKNKILSKFKNNLSKYPISYRGFYNYIDCFYIKKNNLENFFIYSFNWRSSLEGEDYWINIYKDFCNYIKETIYYDDCWSD